MSTATERVRVLPGDAIWRGLRESPAAAVGLAVCLLFVLAAVFAEQIAPADPFLTTNATFRPPSAEFPFGTDDLGRDVFSGVVHGARTSIVIGLWVALISSAIGLAVGLAAGYAGGLLDDVLMRVAEFFLIPPKFFLALVVATAFGPSHFNLILILGLTYWPGTARIIRAETLSLKERGYIEASRAMGAARPRLIVLGILPAVLPLVITDGALKVGGAILIQAGLEFLGVADPTRMSWGYMLHNGQHLMRYGWWMVVFPGLGISALLVGLNLFADGLIRALNPRLTRTYL